MSDLIVSLDEFAELCGVTAETMRVHLRELLKESPQPPAWLVERGDRGRAYKIEAEGGVAWWRDKRDADELATQARKDQLAQLRLEIVGETAESADALSLSGRQRRDEYAAAMEAIKYRKTLGQLLEVADVTRVLTAASVEHRRRLQQLAPEFGIVAGLSADQVKQLDAMIERAVDAFVSSIEDPNAFAS